MLPEPRILLVRLSAIGDIVFASPLVATLRRAHPRAHVAWLVQPECRALLERHPALDEAIVWPYQHWKELFAARRWLVLAREIRAFRRQLRKRRFDLAIDLQGLLKSGMLTRLSSARERIGLGSREGSQWLMTRVIPRGGDPDRIGSEYLFLAEQLGLPINGFAMEIHYGPEDAVDARNLVSDSLSGMPYAVLCPFTTRPQKHWVEPRWAELAGELQAMLGLPAVMLGGPADVEAARRIQEQAGPHLLDLAGRTSLLQAAAIIDRAELLIGVDTGLSHMGIAYGRPSVLLFGSTCPYRNTTRANARVLYQALPCSPCKRNPTCHGDFNCMKAIQVDQVMNSARDLVSRAV